MSIRLDEVIIDQVQLNSEGLYNRFDHITTVVITLKIFKE